MHAQGQALHRAAVRTAAVGAAPARPAGRTQVPPPLSPHHEPPRSPASTLAQHSLICMSYVTRHLITIKFV